MFRTIGDHVPPPAGLDPPPLWGTEERLRELFGDGISSLQTRHQTYVFRYPSAAHFVEYFRDYCGPALKAFEALDEEGRKALERDLEELLRHWPTSDDQTTVVPGDYLEVVAVKQ